MSPDPTPPVSLVVVGPDPGDGVAAIATTEGIDGSGPFEWIRCPGTDPGAVRDALARATGRFVGLVDAGDRLHGDAPALLTAATGAPDVDVVYTDEDVVDGEVHRDPFLKPDWSPERLLAHGYLGRLTLHRTDLAVRMADACTARTRAGFEHELALRCTGAARKVVHVDRILYHRAAPGDAADPGPADRDPADAAAVNAVIAERRLPLRAEAGTRPGPYRLLPALDRHPLVSVVIPTRGTERRVLGRSMVLVENCVTTILDRTTYDPFEVVVVADTDTPASTRAMLASVSARGVRVVEYDRPFNFSEKINAGVVESRGDYVLLLNDDIEITEPAWIDTLLAFASIDGVGAVGPRLCFADGRLQHVGVVLADGGAGHPFYCYPADTRGYHGTPAVTANYVAVTAACLMTRRDRFDEVGGLSPAFPVNYNDVDFCLKLHERGYRAVYTPEVTLPHYESSSRGSDAPRPEELELLRRRWGDLLFADPYYSPRFVPGGNYVTAVRADGRPLDEPLPSYRAALARRMRAFARRARSRS